MTVTAEPAWLTAHEAAARARVHVATLRAAARAGQIEAGATTGGQWRFRPEAVDDWLARGAPRRPDDDA